VQTTNSWPRRATNILTRLCGLLALVSCGGDSSGSEPQTQPQSSEQIANSEVSAESKKPAPRDDKMPSISTRADGDGWTKVAHEEFGFGTNFPASPSYDRKPMPDDSGWFHQLRTSSGKAEYSVFVKQPFSTLPPDVGHLSIALLLWMECKMLANALQTPLALSEPIETPSLGHTCTLHLEDTSSTMLVNVFYARSLTFLVVVVCDDDECRKAQPSIKRFFSSFSFVGTVPS
jgi:hypothetical protein